MTTKQSPYQALIENHLLSFCQRYPYHMTIAYSGGIDSQVLLHAIASLKRQQRIKQSVKAIHVHHGLSAYADNWAEFATQQCEQLGIALKVLKVSIDQSSSDSLEALARTARYQVIAEHLPEQQLLMTAHHANDQIETLFLALKRGAGLAGLSAMAECSVKDHYFIARPLLTISRDDIEAYAEEMNLTWIEDESNLDCTFDRNFIRHQIMPELLARWPQFLTTANRSISHIQQANQLLQQMADDDLQACLIDQTLSLKALLALPIARQQQVIRHFIQQQNKRVPSVAQLAQIQQQLLAAHDKSPSVVIDDYVIRRYNSALYLTPIYQSLEHWELTTSVYHQQPQVTVSLPDNLGKVMIAFKSDELLRAAELAVFTIENYHDEQPLVLTLKFGCLSTRCQPSFLQHHKPLKKVWQSLGIPPWQRQRIPLIFYNEQLVAALGYFVCKEFVPKNKQNSVEFIASWQQSLA